jgi:hypothetical protein
LSEEVPTRPDGAGGGPEPVPEEVKPSRAATEEGGATETEGEVEEPEEPEEEPPPKKMRAKDRRARDRARGKPGVNDDAPAADLDPENEGVHEGPDAGEAKVPLDTALDRAGIEMDPEERERFGEWVKQGHKKGGQHKHYGLTPDDLDRLRNDVADFRGKLRRGR